MGNANFKPIVDQNIIKLYNLFNEESLFYKNSRNSFSSLCKVVYNKDLDIQNNKLITINHKIDKLKKMNIDEYVKDKKIVNDNDKICKEQFIKSLNMFDNNELSKLLVDTKRDIFNELKKEFD